MIQLVVIVTIYAQDEQESSHIGQIIYSHFVIQTFLGG